MQKLIDAHCHMGQTPSQDGVGYIVNSVTESDWGPILDMAKQNHNVFPALGIHPWYADNVTAGWDRRLRQMLLANPHAMVGEIGLDRARGDFDVQTAVFLTQFDIAAQLQRAVHLHCVRTASDLLHVLKTRKLPPQIIIHGFAQNPQVLSRFLEYDNVFISFGPGLLDERHTMVRDCAFEIPMNRILVESDNIISNDITQITPIINMIAKLKHIDNNLVSDTVYDNTKRAIRNGQTK